MRRKDREVTEKAKINQIIENSHCCRIGFQDEKEIYIVPLSFGYEQIDDTYTFYFHSATEGRKIDLIKRNPLVGFELNTNYQLNEGNIACAFSARFQSIIGTGKIYLIEDAHEKLYGFKKIMLHYTQKDEWTFDESMLDKTAMFKMIVSSLSCKEHE